MRPLRWLMPRVAVPVRFEVDNDEVPIPDPLRHVTRVVNALRGYVCFEQAMGHRDKDEQAKVERAQLASRVLTQACRWAIDLHPAP